MQYGQVFWLFHLLIYLPIQRADSGKEISKVYQQVAELQQWGLPRIFTGFPLRTNPKTQVHQPVMQCKNTAGELRMYNLFKYFIHKNATSNTKGCGSCVFALSCRRDVQVRKGAAPQGCGALTFLGSYSCLLKPSSNEPLTPSGVGVMAMFTGKLIPIRSNV